VSSFDHTGCLYIKGRKKLLLNVTDYKVDPLEVESIIGRHPKASNGLMLGQVDPNYGKMVKAVVVVRSGSECTEQEIISYYAQYLIQHIVPKPGVFRSEIPRNPLGKILRKFARLL
jgi:long-chain acyl-CoA synthetase